MFTPARIVVLDDKREHLDAIERAIQDLGSSCVCITYDPGNDPSPDPFLRARLIFMDLQLLGDQFNSNFNQHYAEIQRLLSLVRQPDAGPYLLVLWTAKPDQVDGLREYLEKNLFAESPHTRPVKLVRMSKEEFIELGSGTAKDPQAIRDHIVQQLRSVPAMAALLQWEDEINDASDRVVFDVLKLASSAEVDGQPDVGAALRRLATAAVGAPNVARDPRAAIHSALLPLLEDHVQYEAATPFTREPEAGVPIDTMSHPSGGSGPEAEAEPAFPTPTEGGTADPTILAAASEPSEPDAPGAAAPDDSRDTQPADSADHAELETSGFFARASLESLGTLFSADAPPGETDAPDSAPNPDPAADRAASVWDQALSGTAELQELGRDQAAELNTHLHLGGASARLTSTVWGAICELEAGVDWPNELGLSSEEAYREHILMCLRDLRGNELPAADKLRLLQIRIGAACDYAQKTEGPIPYVLAAFVPASTRRDTATQPLKLHSLQDSSPNWLSPVLKLSAVGHLVVDPRFVRSRGEEAAAAFPVVNRLREQLLMQLIGAVARHGDRPGTVYFEGSDSPLA